MSYKTCLFSFLTIILISCNNGQDLLPKPRAYPKVDYPKKIYEDFVLSECSEISFQKPTYAKVEKDKSKKHLNEIHSCWFDLNIEELNGSIHCSYVPITHDTIFRRLVKESFKVVDHVNKRSNFVEETVIQKENMGGILFTFEGPAASQVQFFLTDSTKHFFKASLYFYTKSRPDSIAPIASFLREDMQKMIETFHWR